MLRRRQKRSRKRRLWCPLFYIPFFIIFAVTSGYLIHILEYQESYDGDKDAMSKCNHFKQDITQIIQNQTDLSIVNEELDKFQKCMKAQVIVYGMTFKNSITYVLSVITTLGYGDLIPFTVAGRYATMVVSIIGIPLYISFTSDTAVLLSDIISCIVAILNRRFLHRHSNGSKTMNTLFLIILFMSYIHLVAAVFYMIERQQEWTYLESLYFTFTSMTLIGFGDYLPSRHLFPFVHLPFIALGQTMLAMNFYIITKQMRFVIPRRFSIFCLQVMLGKGTKETDDSDDECVQTNPMCIQVSDEEIKERSPLMKRVKQSIENILPWSEESGPIETSSHTYSAHARFS
ncbi:unnamed protein product [Bursaphelenchus xylophilus]|uniref:(pine wood nematode) hypothetical protein n=1 Tax=Bursaphelenchus xylophilus TaxID=6326 RepID=A0A7I8WRC8_BURXY|nr:unnamed protein product [Bursaphelenchus xylophilus]CAG9097521.1 unnamed protein product [Bursaphelenchus xylophilus]